MNHKSRNGTIIAAGSAMLAILTACSVPSGALQADRASALSSGDSLAPSPRATTRISQTSTGEMPTSPPSSPTTSPTSSPTSSPAAGDQRERGKRVFEETAGGVGCAYCHGLTGEGKSAPYILDKKEAQIRDALAAVPAMKFETPLGEDDIVAVAAYLEWLNSHEAHH